MGSSGSEGKPPLPGSLGTLVAHKERLVLLAFVPFLLGYGCVIYTAYRMHLGFIPPLQPQCLLAGVVPSLFLLMAYGISLGIEEQVKSAIAWVERPKWPTSLHRLLAVATLMIPAIVQFIVLALRGELNGPNKPSGVSALLMIGFTMAALFAATVVVKAKVRRLNNIADFDDSPKPDLKSTLAETFDEVQPVYAGQVSASLTAIPFLVAIVLLMSWAQVVYPQLPQELGGMRPRIAYFAMDMKALPKVIRTALEPPTQKATKSGTDVETENTATISVPLEVWYERNDTFVIRPLGSKSDTTYEVKKDLIKAMTWNGYAAAETTKAER
mgnify:CR=1 FL=1|jgi:hypothetical protein